MIAVVTGAPDESLFLRACRREPVTATPVWFMRQAGRSLPEYRAVRDRLSMLAACTTADVIAELTLQPLRRFAVDAAILFSDIVVPLRAVGLDIDIKPGVGPVTAQPFRSDADVAKLRNLEPGDVPFITDAVRMLVAEYAPQRVIDLLPAVDVQDSADASSELRTTVGNTGSPFQVPGMENGDANGNLSPMDQQQLIQKLARDVETLQQGMDQLRAGQDQMLRMMLRTPAAASAQARAQVVPPRPAAAGTTGLAAGGLPGLAPNPQPRRPAVPPPPPRFYQ